MTDEIPDLSDPLAAVTAGRFDRLEAALADCPPVDLPLVHRFAPGLYIRQIAIPAGTMVTTRIHKQAHPFFILSGVVRVWSQTEGPQLLTAGHSGLTPPGTRRVLLALSDLVWVTVHANPSNLTDPDALVEQLTEPPVNSLLAGRDPDDPLLNRWKQINAIINTPQLGDSP